MKAVLMSVKPNWCVPIASGEKTVEVRKTVPKLDLPFKCYIYCTSSNVHECLMLNEVGVKLIYATNYKTAIPFGGHIGNGKVIGEFICDNISFTDIVNGNEEVGWYVNNMYAMKGSCLDEYDILNYCPKEATIYGWHISKLLIYKEPKELSSFYTVCKMDCEYCEMWGSVRVNAEEFDMDCKSDWFNHKPLKRPPQSWCYVETLK